MIKILYLCETLGIGGAEQLLLTTLKYLDRSKFDPVVYSIGETGEVGNEMEKIGIVVKSLNKKRYLWNVGIIFELVKIFRKEKPQILHTNLFYPNFFGRVAAIFVKIPIVIITEHGTYSNFKRFYHHWIDLILSFFTTKIITVSASVKEYLSRHALIPPSKMHIIYNAVDFVRFDSVQGVDKVLARRRIGFPDSSIIIGCVSNLASWKGQLVLLRAFSEVIEVLPNSKLCIVGRNTGGFKSQLEVFARKRGFLKSVYFLEERRDIPELLKTFDLFVFPSLTEGLGISLLEAMYMGLPAVASNIEGIAEIIEDNNDGALVTPGDFKAMAEKILVFLHDNEKIEKISCNAIEKVKKKFSPLVYIKNLETCYEKLIETKSNKLFR